MKRNLDSQGHCEGNQKLSRNWFSIIEWAKERGAVFSKLELRNDCEFGRGMFALDSITAGEEIVSIPASMAISEESALRSKLGQLVQNTRVEFDNKSLLFLYMVQQKYDPEGEFHVYFADVPQTFPDLPITWSEEEHEKYLTGTDALKAVTEKRKQLKQQFQDFCKVVENIPEFESILSFEEFLWANCVWTSRAFPAEMSGNTGCGCLLPLMDLMNHRAKTSIIWEKPSLELENSRIIFRAGENFSVRADQQVFNNYGAKSTLQWLLGYGFCPKENAQDSMPISFGGEEENLYFLSRGREIPSNLLEFLYVSLSVPEDRYFQKVAPSVVYSALKELKDHVLTKKCETESFKQEKEIVFRFRNAINTMVDEFVEKIDLQIQGLGENVGSVFRSLKSSQFIDVETIHNAFLNVNGLDECLQPVIREFEPQTWFMLWNIVCKAELKECDATLLLFSHSENVETVKCPELRRLLEMKEYIMFLAESLDSFFEIGIEKWLEYAIYTERNVLEMPNGNVYGVSAAELPKNSFSPSCTVELVLDDRKEVELSFIRSDDSEECSFRLASSRDSVSQLLKLGRFDPNVDIVDVSIPDEVLGSHQISRQLPLPKNLQEFLKQHDNQSLDKFHHVLEMTKSNLLSTREICTRFNPQLVQAMDNKLSILDFISSKDPAELFDH